MFKALSKKQFPKQSTSCDDGSSHSDGTDTSVTTCERTVTFCESVVVRRVMPLSAYTADEIASSWYSEYEYRYMNQQCQKEIRKLNEGKRLRDKKYCSRGLEGGTDVGMNCKLEHRQLAYLAVLSVQASLNEQGLHDDEAIAKSYREVSFPCQWFACVVGSRDQRAVGL